MVSTATNLTISRGYDSDFQSIINAGVPYSWISHLEIVSKCYQQALNFPFIATAGIYYAAAQNGSQAFLGVYPLISEIHAQDVSLGGDYYDYILTGVNTSGIVTYSSPPSKISTGISISYINYAAGSGYWGAPIPSSGPNTYLLPFSVGIWKNMMPLQQNASENYRAAVFSSISARSIEDYMQTITMTANGVLALVDANTGYMIASTTRNISVSWPTIYPAIGNPNGLVSAGASAVAAAYGSPAASSASGAFAAITSRASLNFQFAYGGDSVYCTTSWIADSNSNLALLLIVMVPSNDFLAPVNVSTRNAVIFIVVFTAFSFAVGLLISWALTVPLRWLTASIKKATNFDFSPLHDGFLNRRSPLSEVAVLESSFAAMLKKFAQAIQANKSGTGGSASKSVMSGNPTAGTNSIRQ
ncbi:hypothetical protein HK405_006470 [Cladochytrium tenue]|nr:hypothetical protein HK405_006470 [Cladochytrium tenue]